MRTPCVIDGLRMAAAPDCRGVHLPLSGRVAALTWPKVLREKKSLIPDPHNSHPSPKKYVSLQDTFPFALYFRVDVNLLCVPCCNPVFALSLQFACEVQSSHPFLSSSWAFLYGGDNSPQSAHNLKKSDSHTGRKKSQQQQGMDGGSHYSVYPPDYGMCADLRDTVDARWLTVCGLASVLKVNRWTARVSLIMEGRRRRGARRRNYRYNYR